MANFNLRRNVNSFEDCEHNFSSLFRVLQGSLDISNINLPEGFFINPEEGFGFTRDDGELVFQISPDGSLNLTGAVSIGHQNINDISNETKDELNEEVAYLMGYDSYNDLMDEALMGSTIIRGGYINTDLIQTGAIVAGHIASKTITSNEIKAGAITATEIEAHAIDASKIISETITADEIASDTITAEEIAADTITAEEINVESLAADEAFIGELGVKELFAEKLWSEGILADKIKTDEAFIEDLQAEVVNAEEIFADYFETNTIDADNITAGTITADRIKANTIDANNNDMFATGANAPIIPDHLAVDKLSAITANVGTLTAGTIDGVVIWAGTGHSIAQNEVSMGTEGLIVREESLKIRSYDAQDEPLDSKIYNSAAGLNFVPTSGLNAMFHGDVVPDDNETRDLGNSSFSWDTAYYKNSSGCPLPTSNSAIDVMKKVNNPEIRTASQGERHYFNDEDFPEEMKFKNDKGEEEIERIRTLGVTVQTVRELIDKVEELERRN